MCKFVTRGFLVLYGLAALVWLIGIFGMFGVERDPMSAVFLIMLGLPWSRWVDILPESLWLIGSAVAPAINAAIIYAVCSLRRKRKARTGLGFNQ